MTQERKHRITTAIVVTASLAALAIAFSLPVMLSDAVKSPAPFATVDRDQQTRYVPFSGAIEPAEYARVFNGKKNVTGSVINIADASTNETKKACMEDWPASSAYHVLCDGLADQIILTVKLDLFSMPVTTYVPVSKIAKVHVGEKILIQSADIKSDGEIRALPKYLRTMAF